MERPTPAPNRSSPDPTTALAPTNPTAHDFPELQDLLGPLTHTIYTQLCLAFPFDDAIPRAQIMKTLKDGAEKLSLSFPWLAGQIVIDGGTPWPARQLVAGGDVSPRPKIVPLEQNFRLIEKDHTSNPAVLSMEELVKAKFPVRLLDGTILTPLTGRPSKYRDAGEYPVFLIQANFIKGGVLLSFAGEHSTMDGHGLGETIRLFHKACHNEAFTTEELFEGNRARGDIVPLLDVDPASYKSGPELHYMFAKRASNEPPAARPTCSWACFRLSAARLSALNSLARDGSNRDVSTDDVASAFSNQSFFFIFPI
jgi:hypothetical protein